MPTALKDGEPVTELIHQCYQWLVDYMVSQGQEELSSIGYAPDLITAAELQVLQQGDPTLPQGPYVPEQQPPADPIIPAGATQHQIAQAIRQNTEAKARYTKRIGVINKAKKYWIKMCSEDNFEDLRDPILGLAGNTLCALVDHIFDDWSVFDKNTRDKLHSEMTQEWTGGPLAPAISTLDDAKLCLPPTDQQERRRNLPCVVSSFFLRL